MAAGREYDWFTTVIAVRVHICDYLAVYSQRKSWLKVVGGIDIWLYKGEQGQRCNTKSGACRARRAQCIYPPALRYA